MSDKYAQVEEDYDYIDQAFHDSYDTTKELPDQIASFVSGLSKGSSILNIGGTLPECRYFLKHDLQVTDIDISQAMLDHITELEPQVKAIKSNIKDYKDTPFDAIWACRSLIHIPPGDMDVVFKNIRELLRANGIFGSVFFTTIQAQPIEEEKPEWQTKKQGTLYYRVLYPTNLIQTKIETTGFKVIKTEDIKDLDGDKGIYMEAL